MRAAFDALHRRRFGYVDEAASRSSTRWSSRRSAPRPERARRRPARASGRRSPSGAEITASGPALIFDPSSTTVVEPGWQRDARRRRHADPDPRRARSTAPTPIGTDADPVRLEIFNNLFMAIAEEMGVALQSTATSVNIKERLDFSCALFDATGALIANAPHIPVHLGSMGESIRTIIEARGDGARRARHPARRRLCAQRSLSRRHASARHHGDRAGVLRRRRRGAVGLRRGARPPCRHRRDRAGIDAARQPHDRRGRRADRQCTAGRRGPFPRGRDARVARRRATGRRAIPTATSPTCSAQLAACVARRRSAGRDRARLWRATWSRPTWATSSPMPRNRCGGCSTGSTTARSTMRWTMARAVRVAITDRQGGALGDVRFHRHQRPAGRQFQRALFDRAAPPRSMSCGP